jgi:PAS domain S-box-containing protein
MKTVNTKRASLLNSYAIRHFAIFAAVFFFITTLLTAFVIIPKINGSIESQYIKDTQEELSLEVELFVRYVQSQKTVLQDLARFPSLTSAVMLSDGSSMAISDLFENVVIGGEQGQLILQDIEATPLIQTNNNLRGVYTYEQSWMQQVLDGSLPYHFQLLGQDQERFTFQMSIPVVYDHYIEGVLSAEITVPLSRVFVTQTFNKDIAFRLTQGQSAIFTQFEHIEIARENSIQLDLPDLTFTYITDDGPIREEARSLRNSILLVLLVGLALSFILFTLLAYRSLVVNDKVIKMQRSLWLVYAMPIFVSAIGVGASFAAYLAITNIQHASQEANLVVDSRAKVQSLRDNINSSLDVLDSVKAFFDATNNVTRLDFKTFTQPLLVNHRSIQALEWVPYVADNQREAFEHEARLDGLKDFAITARHVNGKLTTSPSQGSYFPVYFVEPLTGNENAVGFDLSSNNKRFAALLKARNTGKKIATSKITLVQEEKSQTGLLLLHAVYDNSIALDGVASRESQLQGFVVMVLKIENFIRDVIGYELDGHPLFIQDVTEANTPDTLFGVAPETNAFMRAETLDVAGRYWRVTTSSTLSQMPLWWISWLVLISGLVFTALIVVGLVNLIRRREVVEMLVEQRTADLRILSSTVANSNDVFIITQANELNEEHGGPQITYVNEAFTRLTGYSSEEALGNTPRMLQGRNTDRNELDKIRSALEKGETYIGELINYSKDGEEYWIDLNISPLKDQKGNITHYASVERDITGRKQAQQEREKTRKELEQLIEKIYESNELNDAIMSSSDHLIIVTDPNGLTTFVNQAAEKGLGYQSAEVVGVHSPALWHDGNEVVQRASVLSTELGKSVEPGFDVFTLKTQQGGRDTQDWTITRKNGTSFIGSLTVTCIRNSYGEITGYLGVIEDITERKAAEKEREGLIDKLVDSNEELERFAFVCSHDLQEPLRMIRSFSEKLQTHIADTLEHDEKGKKYLHFVTDGAVRAQALVVDILAYSSIGTDTQLLEDVVGEDLINVVKDNMQNVLLENGGGITCDPLPILRGNKTQLFQLFQNLINNGMKYRKLDTPPKVHVSVKDAGDCWQFAIKDNGIGMEQRHLKKIFEVFQRLHRKSQYAGTGVGLSICKKVVERHGGIIWVESEKGVGSTFYFTLLKPNLI